MDSFQIRGGTRLKGAIEISFFSDDELERILQLLGISSE